jgi:hypothetical protein
MTYLLITKDPFTEDSFLSPEAFLPSDRLMVFGKWEDALDACAGVDLMFVELTATLDEPFKIAGYERFARAKMGHPIAADVPLVLVAAPADYELDFMVGFPDFVFAQVAHPISSKIFRRASTWI